MPLNKNKMAILVDTSVVNDSRVLKHIESGTKIGFDVLTLGFSSHKSFRLGISNSAWVVNRLQTWVRRPSKKFFNSLTSVDGASAQEKTGSALSLLARLLSFRRLIYLLSVIRINFFVYGWLKRTSPQIVLVNDPHFLWAATRFKKMCSETVRVVYDSHENFLHYSKGNMESQALALSERLFAPKVDAVSAVSPSIGEEMHQRLKLDAAPLILKNLPSIGLQRKSERNIRVDMGIEDEDFLFVYSGIASPERGIQDLLEAMCHVPEAFLALVVDSHPSTKARLSKMLGERSLSDRCKVLPYVSPQESTSYISNADASVIPFHKYRPDGTSHLQHESALANKLFDSWNANISIVYSNCREMSNFLRDGDAVEEFLAQDISSLIEAMRKSMLHNRPISRPKVFWEDQVGDIREFITGHK